MDELNGWSPPVEVNGCDLAVLPMGICEFDLFTGERLIHEEHPVLQFEATFAETLEIVAELDAERVVLSHVEEMDCISYDELVRVEQRLRARGATSPSPGTASRSRCEQGDERIPAP